MMINDKIKKILFIVVYTVVTTMLIINTVKFKLVIDIIYTTIFVAIYLKYLYITISK